MFSDKLYLNYLFECRYSRNIPPKPLIQLIISYFNSYNEYCFIFKNHLLSYAYINCLLLHSKITYIVFYEKNETNCETTKQKEYMPWRQKITHVYMETVIVIRRVI